jgi:hypothetical protein
MAVRLHLMMCRHCSNFKKQMLFLRRAGASYVEYLEKTGRKESVKR